MGGRHSARPAAVELYANGSVPTAAEEKQRFRTRSSCWRRSVGRRVLPKRNCNRTLRVSSTLRRATSRNFLHGRNYRLRPTDPLRYCRSRRGHRAALAARRALPWSLPARCAVSLVSPIDKILRALHSLSHYRPIGRSGQWIDTLRGNLQRIAMLRGLARGL